MHVAAAVYIRIGIVVLNKSLVTGSSACSQCKGGL